MPVATESPSAARAVRRAPAERTTFVGRRRELADAKARLSTARLVTVVGPGGVGKTRLALRVAEGVSRNFVAGAWFVELAGLRDPALLAEHVAVALELPPAASGWAVGGLADHLRGKRLLLVLDNCEHLIEACAVLVEALLRASPDLRVLATSREPLRVDGESVLPLPPLSLPAEREGASLSALIRSEAVALLLQRATASAPGFAVDATNAELVARLCRRLDGIPLAIELAAVNLGSRPLAEVLAEIADSTDALARGRQVGEPRHRTIHATVAWSYSLLSDEERLVWRRLGAFAGSFTSEAAAAVCDVPAARTSAMLAALVEKSMVVREPASNRYRLLETLRDHALANLRASGELAVTQQRHRDWFTDRALAADAASWPGDTIERASPDLDDWRAALQGAVADQAGALRGLELCTALYPFWDVQGRTGEGRRWLRALLTVVTGSSRARAKAIAGDGYLAALQGDHEASRSLLEQAGAMAREHGDDRTLAMTLVWGAAAHVNLGDIAAAEPPLDEAIARFERAGDAFGIGFASMGLGVTWLASGSPDRARPLLEDAVARLRDHPWMLGHALRPLGVAKGLLGDRAAGERLLKESIRLLGGLRYERALALSVESLAWITSMRGDAERAATLLGCAVALRRSVGTVLPGVWQSHHDVCDAAVRERLGQRAADAAIAKGASWSTEAAVSFALEEPAVAGEMPRTAARTAATADKRPSPRERETARLVGRGLSNKEIAAELVLSERTVETHVRHLMDKLGVSSRVEIAVWAADLPED